MNMNRLTQSGIVVAIAGIAAAGFAGDIAPAERSRLEAARIAFDEAKIELDAALAEISAENQAETEIANENATRRVQPDVVADVPEYPTSWKDGWDWTANAGFSGASGNNENFSARLSLGGTRNTSKYETSLTLSYLFGTSDGSKNTARGELKLKNDWLTDGKWRYFAQGGYEYDEFQAWQHRFSAAGGVGYEFIKDDKTTLVGRAGLGGSYDAGSNANETLVPEALLGLDWSYQLSTNTKLVAASTFFPSFDDFGEFRWNSGAGLEVLLDAETGMTMTAGLDHRHDSDPGTGIKPNDVDYYMGIGWKF